MGPPGPLAVKPLASSSNMIDGLGPVLLPPRCPGRPTGQQQNPPSSWRSSDGSLPVGAGAQWNWSRKQPKACSAVQCSYDVPSSNRGRHLGSFLCTEGVIVIQRFTPTSARLARCFCSSLLNRFGRHYGVLVASTSASVLVIAGACFFSCFRSTAAQATRTPAQEAIVPLSTPSRSFQGPETNRRARTI